MLPKVSCNLNQLKGAPSRPPGVSDSFHTDRGKRGMLARKRKLKGRDRGLKKESGVEKEGIWHGKKNCRVNSVREVD